jgi:hypothetical protein
MKMDRLIEAMKRWTKPWTSGSEPLEIRRAVLEDVESRIVSAGVGKKVFPYNRVHVRLFAANEQERVDLDAIVRDAWDLPRDIRDRLAQWDSRVPPGFHADVAVEERAEPLPDGRRFRVEYERDEGAASAAAAPVAAPERPAVEVTVIQGTSTEKVYQFPAVTRINLGRLREVLDEEGRVRRRNDVAFAEDGEHSQTVSREHARIVWDERSSELRLRTEPGASGTRIVREGRSIEVSGHDSRGIRLQSGDEVWLGRACVKVTFR